MRSSTRIRLIEPADAAPIAAHRVQDVEAFRPWEPAQPAGFFTPEGQAERIDRLLAGYRCAWRWPANSWFCRRRVRQPLTGRWASCW